MLFAVRTGGMNRREYTVKEGVNAHGNRVQLAVKGRC
jgi:hypothetical protein